MDEKLRETAKLCVEIMNRKRQVKGKLGHLKQIRVALPFNFDVNVMLNLSNTYTISGARALASVILAGKRGNRRHPNRSFSVS